MLLQTEITEKKEIIQYFETKQHNLQDILSLWLYICFV